MTTAKPRPWNHEQHEKIPTQNLTGSCNTTPTTKHAEHIKCEGGHYLTQLSSQDEKKCSLLPTPPLLSPKKTEISPADHTVHSIPIAQMNMTKNITNNFLAKTDNHISFYDAFSPLLFCSLSCSHTHPLHYQSHFPPRIPFPAEHLAIATPHD